MSPGGYHPVNLGDVITNGDRKYAIVAKLGHGGFASVLQGTASQHISDLKFSVPIAIDEEFAVLQHLKTTAGADHPNIIELHNSFKICGPNGEHHCLVFPILDPNLNDVIMAEAISGTVRHQVCQQMARAVSFLHKNGLCYGGMP